MIDERGARLAAELFNLMTLDQKNSVSDAFAMRISHFMIENGYCMVFTRWYRQAESKINYEPSENAADVIIEILNILTVDQKKRIPQDIAIQVDAFMWQRGHECYEPLLNVHGVIHYYDFQGVTYLTGTCGDLILVCPNCGNARLIKPDTYFLPAGLGVSGHRCGVDCMLWYKGRNCHTQMEPVRIDELESRLTPLRRNPNHENCDA